MIVEICCCVWYPPIWSVLPFLTLLHLCYRRKTSAKSFNPDVTTEEEEDVKKPDVTPQKFEMQKTSLQVSYVQQEQDKDADNESIEMVPLPVGGGYS